MALNRGLSLWHAPISVDRGTAITQRVGMPHVLTSSEDGST